MALTLGLLLWLHGRLDVLLDPGDFRILDAEAFETRHRWYLHTSTVQWACAIAFGILSVGAWRAEDRKSGAAPPASA